MLLHTQLPLAFLTSQSSKVKWHNVHREEGNFESYQKNGLQQKLTTHLKFNIAPEN